jgi:hypothetical protein
MFPTCLMFNTLYAGESSQPLSAPLTHFFLQGPSPCQESSELTSSLISLFPSLEQRHFHLLQHSAALAVRCLYRVHKHLPIPLTAVFGLICGGLCCALSCQSSPPQLLV